VPFFVYFLFQDEIFYHIIAFVMFVIASLTDLVDGYLARKWKQETEFGKFLDPLADKILVVGCFVTFILLDDQIELWMVLLIILRDMLITTLRFLAIRQGKSVRTTMMGKLKTTFQMSAIVLILFFFMLVSIGKRNTINGLYETGRQAGKTVFQIALENSMRFDEFVQAGSGADGVIFYLSTFIPYFAMLFTTFITVLSGMRYLFTNSELLKPGEIYKLMMKGK
ncbi:MAG: CDP-diacylglycerol--glycerol-3-phosphate 3-phosphatidyltransferase, partial [Leptospira sp.]|nr:CDP-diacylglycerol--glycerol-3-phosphate 3-phosphatidyltransferase [Leptospira sp.]